MGYDATIYTADKSVTEASMLEATRHAVEEYWADYGTIVDAEIISFGRRQGDDIADRRQWVSAVVGELPDGTRVGFGVLGSAFLDGGDGYLYCVKDEMFNGTFAPRDDDANISNTLRALLTSDTSEHWRGLKD